MICPDFVAPLAASSSPQQQQADQSPPCSAQNSEDHRLIPVEAIHIGQHCIRVGAAGGHQVVLAGIDDQNRADFLHQCVGLLHQRQAGAQLQLAGVDQ